MTINDKVPTAKSPLVDAQDKGQVEIGGKARKVVKGDRKTDQGKQVSQEAEAKRLKEKAMFKATLKK